MSFNCSHKIISDTILLNGRFWTAEPSQPWAEAMWISGSTIHAVGLAKEIQAQSPKNCHTINLKGKLCLPGLWDAHIHFYFWSLGLGELKLQACKSREEVLVKLSLFSSENPDLAWITGTGWDESEWEDSRILNRQELDEATACGRPVLLYRKDMHTAIANTTALESSGLLDTKLEVPGGKIERDHTGLPNGILRELAINLVQKAVPPPTAGATDQALLLGSKHLHRFGITGFCDQRVKGQDDGPKAYASLARLNQLGQLQQRVSCNITPNYLPLLKALGQRAGDGDDRLRLGHVKLFADGTLGSRSAATFEPYLTESENFGMMLSSLDEISNDTEEAILAGFPVSIHCIGDRAIRSCLDILEQNINPKLSLPSPHRLEHVQILADEDLNRLASLNITASLQPVHIWDDIDNAERFLGPRSRLVHRLGALSQSQALLAFGSDGPVAEINPFHGMQAALTRQAPDRNLENSWQSQERLSIEEIVRAYTIGAVTASGCEHLTGSFKVGKGADLCVLNQDIFNLAESAETHNTILSTQVLFTMFDGQIVYSHPDW